MFWSCSQVLSFICDFGNRLNPHIYLYTGVTGYQSHTLPSAVTLRVKINDTKLVGKPGPVRVWDESLVWSFQILSFFSTLHFYYSTLFRVFFVAPFKRSIRIDGHPTNFLFVYFKICRRESQIPFTIWKTHEIESQNYKHQIINIIFKNSDMVQCVYNYTSCQ